MKRPVVSYKDLRLNNLTSPKYRHLMYLLGWVGYFTLYFLTENLISPERCTPVYAPLDDCIPFLEGLIIPYVGWYGLIVVSLLYFALYNPKNFRNLQLYIIVTQVIAMAIYILFPTRQDLRPEQFPRENILTDLIRFLYAFDTNTGVCPSLHVAYSLGIASTWLREKSASRLTKTAVVIFVILVCLSVVFVKQHSVIDIFAALPVCAFAEWFVFYRPGKPSPRGEGVSKADG